MGTYILSHTGLPIFGSRVRVPIPNHIFSIIMMPLPKPQSYSNAAFTKYHKQAVHFTRYIQYRDTPTYFVHGRNTGHKTRRTDLG